MCRGASRSDGGTVLFAVDDGDLLDAATVVLQLAATPDVFVLATVGLGSRA